MSILNPWNLALVYIMGAEIIHLFQIKFAPDLIIMDQKDEKLIQKYKLRDIYPFLLIEIFYLVALFYLLFSPHHLLWLYAISLLILGLIKIYFQRRIKNRFLFIKIESIITIVLTIILIVITNTERIS